MLNALLFDLDGTLTDTDRIHLLAMQQLLLEEGRVFTEDEFDQHVSGRANAELCRYLFPDRDVEHHQAFADRKEALFRALSPTLQPVQGLLRLLDFADSRQLGMAVVTNAPRANANHMLAALGLTGRFKSVLVAEELPRAKPDPLPYLTGLAHLQAQAHQALAFEDSIPGVRAASGAGIFTVGIATSQSHPVLIEAGAKLVVDDFNDERLWQLIERMAPQSSHTF
ncbi:HAD family phosphatase [Pseudomonas sp. R5(2019)]|uniref:HAD family hydrolase n=1 Tax=Pseudomonas sp. R5(2019) TaxID=2697566 RepID=UPI00141374C2|nr:HAD-IA family hydrolase [Pseudomonas sp. R5(2019)]NBA96590.1 HAD-IA family hydrolase [Pseudomonas sp. R5(2019)]